MALAKVVEAAHGEGFGRAPGFPKGIQPGQPDGCARKEQEYFKKVHGVGF
jgi:hypothetical protein